MQVTGGVCHDTRARALEAEQAIRGAAAQAAARDNKPGDSDPALGAIQLDGVQLGKKGRWWGRVELDPGSQELRKAWLTYRHAPVLGAASSSTYVFEKDGAETKLGYSKSTDGLLRGDLTVFETSLDASGQPTTATTLLGQPSDLAAAKFFFRNPSFWKSPIPLPPDVDTLA